MIERVIKKTYKMKNEKKINKVGIGFYVEYPFYLIGVSHITIGNAFSATAGVRIEAWDRLSGHYYKPQVIIGNNVALNYRTHIGAVNKIVIGDGVAIGSNVLIINHNHGKLDRRDKLEISHTSRELYSKGEIIIQDNVWIGDNACVLSGVFIGRGAVIGTNSVVTRSVPAYIPLLEVIRLK